MTPSELYALRVSITPTAAELSERGDRDRDRRGLLQRELAARLGVSANTVYRWESGTLPILARTELAVRGMK